MSLIRLYSALTSSKYVWTLFLCHPTIHCDMLVSYPGFEWPFLSHHKNILGGLRCGHFNREIILLCYVKYFDTIFFPTMWAFILEIVSTELVNLRFKLCHVVCRNYKYPASFKWYFIGSKDQNVCQENIIHDIAPPQSPALSVATKQNGSTFSYCLHLIQCFLSWCRKRNQELGMMIHNEKPTVCDLGRP